MLTPAGRIGRADYLKIGVGLMALKYAVDAALIYWWADIVWTPVDYVLSLANLEGAKPARFPSALTLALLVWTVPFIWVGLMLSVRRARDAGVPGWLVVLFFIPVANYALMAALAAWPTAPIVTLAPPAAAEDAGARSRASLAGGVAAGVAAGLLLMLIGVATARTYGSGLFLAAPFIVGVVSAFVARRMDPASSHPVIVVMTTLAFVLASAVLVALEGLVCLLMAAPLMIPVMLAGGAIGHMLAGARRETIFWLLVVGAGGQVVEASIAAPSALREVLTTIDIAAPPEAVWANVVSFADIRTPPAWYFRTGLSYPLRARIEGSGVGAVRYCEFTTGAFREPITAWEEPNRLAFDVTDQPPPLREWSPYSKVYAPHLDGFFRTSRGEFRLVALPGGGTRLEGRTWYTLRMEPQGYWTLMADAVLHRIHHRVLEHIKRQAESR